MSSDGAKLAEEGAPDDLVQAKGPTMPDEGHQPTTTIFNNVSFAAA